MLFNIILRSTAAFGGAPFRFKKCTALGSAGTGAGIGAAAGGVPGALVGGALGIASSLIGGLFGKSNTNKTNQMNYKIMQEQNQLNREEAQKNRDWQEMMYRMFGTSSAKANDMRAAGLNSLLGDVSASEKMSYLRELAAKDKEVRDKAAAALKEKEEKEKAEKDNADFQSRYCRGRANSRARS